MEYYINRLEQLKDWINTYKIRDITGRNDFVWEEGKAVYRCRDIMPDYCTPSFEKYLALKWAETH